MYTQREQQYQRLLDRLHSLNNLKSLPDQLFGYLLAKSDPVPISVPKGVILFRQGECVQGWYLLLSGEVQLYIEQTTSQSDNKFIEQQIKIIGPGTLFGALQTCHKHSCSAKILKNAEFVRIPQNNFLLIYNKWADRLQSCIVLMEDLNNNNIQNPPKSNRQLPKLPNEKKRKTKEEKENNNNKLQQNEQLKNKKINNLNEEKIESKNIENGFLLEIKDLFQYDDKQLFFAAEILANEMSNCSQQLTGSEFCDKLINIWIDCFNIPLPSNYLIELGIGQLLLDNSLLIISKNSDHNPQFNFSSIYYWSLPSISENKLKYFDKQILANSLIFLANSGRDSLLQTILKKPKDYRTEEELKLILEEINYIRGFSYLSKGIKRGIAKIICLEIVEYAGTIIFKKGDLANCWYTVLNGYLEAKSEGKKSIIREGDDFGKLSILNNEYKNGNQQKNNLRQTTVLTSQNDCQLLKINSSDFKQIISEIESKTIRLKQEIQDFNEDFLILQKDSENL
uniref:Cyclic nucleotide-binding domain-containing protein n=1 Tax=Meloidogyne enterolobii TaxID=390850 RepID=A0A6V7WVN0_MELEN|nr:unnamed protein product [Meloidogyne enterolobii]